MPLLLLFPEKTLLEFSVVVSHPWGQIIERNQSSLGERKEMLKN